MNCENCGGERAETDKACPICGAVQPPPPSGGTPFVREGGHASGHPAEGNGHDGGESGAQVPPEFTDDKAEDNANRNEVVLLAQKAMGGDDSVWGEIYEKTQRYVYYMALKFLRSEQDAQDITQEVFIQAIRSIGQLYTADSFFGWLRSIITSKCKDLMKKKKPVLLDEEEDGGSPFDDVPEMDDNFIPDMALDSAETRRMILELIDALPYSQRQAVMFYYYDEMTVDQIAAVMECPPGTVKSRLNYARQQIKKGVEEHERKGVKLYGVAALPVLSILLREQAKTLLMPSSISGGLGTILGQAAGTAAGGASAGAGGATAASTAAATAAKASVPLVTKIIAGVIAGTVVIGGGVMLLTNNDETDDNAATPPPITELIPLETDSPDISIEAADDDAAAVQPEENSPGEEDEEEPVEEEEYYDTLSNEQKQLLSRLETALRTTDYSTAYSIQGSAEFQALCDEIPDWGGFWYYSDEETSVLVYRGFDGGYGMNVFAGKGGNGEYCSSRYGGSTWENYVMAATKYSGGKPNGPFEQHFINYNQDQPEFMSEFGNLTDGEPYGKVFIKIKGELTEREYEPGWYNQWPDWPER